MQVGEVHLHNKILIGWNSLCISLTEQSHKRDVIQISILGEFSEWCKLLTPLQLWGWAQRSETTEGLNNPETSKNSSQRTSNFLFIFYTLRQESRAMNSRMVLQNKCWNWKQKEATKRGFSSLTYVYLNIQLMNTFERSILTRDLWRTETLYMTTPRKTSVRECQFTITWFCFCHGYFQWILSPTEEFPVLLTTTQISLPILTLEGTLQEGIAAEHGWDRNRGKMETGCLLLGAGMMGSSTPSWEWKDVCKILFPFLKLV